MELKTGNDWEELLSGEVTQPYFLQIMSFLKSEKQSYDVYPPEPQIFSALQKTSYESTKVVILGQDPYSNEGQACGIAFSVQSDTSLPPSLKNILSELASDLGTCVRSSGDLSSWAEQGVLLLNTCLSVRRGQPASHARCGWQSFTDRIISLLGSRKAPTVFILWGKSAQEKAALIAPHHCIITSPHPSPLSAHRGFFGSKPFSRANAFLVRNGQAEIDWNH